MRGADEDLVLGRPEQKLSELQRELKFNVDLMYFLGCMFLMSIVEFI